MSESLASLARIHYGKSPNEALAVDGDIPVLGTGGVYAKANRALFDSGVVVARKGSLGTPHLMRGPFWPSDTTFAVLPNPGTDLGWLYFNLLRFDLTKLNEATGVPSISREWLAKVRFERPSPFRQRRIAAILTSVDNAIEATEALIEKNQQIKAGLMHDLFTRGMRPSGHLRPTSLVTTSDFQDSIAGPIPKSWRLAALGEVCSVIVDCPHSTPSFKADGVLVARTMHIKDGAFLEAFASRVSEREYAQRVERAVPQPGDVVLTREAPVGEAFVIPTGMRVCLGQRVMLIRPNRECLLPVYLVNLIYGGFVGRQMRDQVAGTTNPHLNVADVRRLVVPLPPIAEQIAIADALVAQATRISADQVLLAKLRLQKLGLMQDLLTGKVPVNLPEPAVPA